jgi:hypothetical protein
MPNHGLGNEEARWYASQRRIVLSGVAHNALRGLSGESSIDMRFTALSRIFRSSKTFYSGIIC